MAKHLNQRQCEHLEFWFCFTAKGSFPAFIPILYPESFMLCKNAVYNDLSSDVYTLCGFQLRTQSVPLFFFNWLIIKHTQKKFTKKSFTVLSSSVFNSFFIVNVVSFVLKSNFFYSSREFLRD